LIVLLTVPVGVALATSYHETDTATTESMGAWADVTAGDTSWGNGNAVNAASGTIGTTISVGPAAYGYNISLVYNNTTYLVPSIHQDLYWIDPEHPSAFQKSLSWTGLIYNPASSGTVYATFSTEGFHQCAADVSGLDWEACYTDAVVTVPLRATAIGTASVDNIAPSVQSDDGIYMKLNGQTIRVPEYNLNDVKGQILGLLSGQKKEYRVFSLNDSKAICNGEMSISDDPAATGPRFIKAV
jgi:hypothetical protein